MRAALRIQQRVVSTAAATVAALLAACGGGSDGMSMPGSTAMGCMPGADMSCMAPTVTMHAPGTTIHLTVTLRATVTSMMMDEAMPVDFMVDGTRVGTATMAPYGVQWDSTAVSDGSHTLTARVMASMGQTVTSAPVSVSVENNPTLAVSLSPTQLMPVPASSAAGTASLAVKLASGALSGKVTLSGMAASAVTLNEAFAGNSGAPLLTLRTGAGSGQWGPARRRAARFEQVTALLQGKLYLIARVGRPSARRGAWPARPADVVVSFSGMDGARGGAAGQRRGDGRRCGHAR